MGLLGTRHCGVHVWLPSRYARFDGHHERVLFHAKDCIDVGTPSAGAAVSAFVHRRRDGKLQAFKVMSDSETMKERLDRVHSQLLGSS